MPFPTTAPAQAPASSAIDMNVSASQLKTWRLCKRKWWFEKVAKLKDRDKHHFVVGHVFHSIAERYLMRHAKTWEELFPIGWDEKLEGEEKDWARRMAEEAVTRGLWQAKDGIAVEFPIAYLVGRQHRDARGLPLLAEAETYEDKDGVRRIAKLTRLIDGRPLPAGALALPPFVGFIDQLDLSYMPPGITDHKTAKSRRYALTPEKLAQDTQVLSYAAVPLVLVPDQDRVRLRHNVFLKDPSAPEPVYAVDAETTLSKVVEHWETVIRDSEDMALVRQIAPVPPSPKERNAPKNAKRADNFHLVRSAIDEGRAKDACNCYGGCPFRDVCFGRSSAEQLTRRMDMPDPMALVQAKAPTFGLNLHPAPSTYRPRTGLIVKESNMVFAKPSPPPAPAPLAIGMHVFLVDPEKPTQQFKATVANHGNPGACDPMLALWPDASVEPEITSLDRDTYIVQVPDASVLRSPDPQATLIGYADALKAAGMPAPGWVAKPQPKTASLVAPNTPDAEKLTKSVSRPERDGRFGLAPAAATAPAATPAAAAPAQQPVQQQQQPPAPVLTPPPQATFQPAVGQKVRVLPTDHSFWSQLAHRVGTITALADSENGPLATIEVEGLPYPDVAIGRLALADAPAAPAALDPEQVKALVGHIVCVRVLGDNNIPNPLPVNGALESVADNHLVMFGGSTKIPFAKVYSLTRFDAKDAPGAKLPKPPKAPGKGRKTKAQKEAEAQAAAQQQPAPAATSQATGAQGTGTMTFPAAGGDSLPAGSVVGTQPLSGGMLADPAQLSEQDRASIKARMQDILRAMQALSDEISNLAREVGA